MNVKMLFHIPLDLSDPPWHVVSIDFDQPAGRGDISMAMFMTPY